MASANRTHLFLLAVLSCLSSWQLSSGQLTMDNLRCVAYKSAARLVFLTTVWPASRGVALTGTAPSVFDPDVRGRVIPTGAYKGSNEAIEHFYALSGPLNEEDQFSPRVTNVDFKWLVCEANQRRVAFEVILQFSSPKAWPGMESPAQYNVSTMGSFVFNSRGKICSYDLDMRALGAVMAASTVGSPMFGGEVGYAGYTAEAVCAVHDTYCLGDLAQYTDKLSCMVFMSTKIPLGDFNSADQNNLICRSMHAALVPLRPQVHCATLGVSGGGQCMDRPASSLFAEDYSKCEEPW